MPTRTLAYGHRSAFWTRRRLVALVILSVLITAGLAVHRFRGPILQRLSYQSAQRACLSNPPRDRQSQFWTNLMSASNQPVSIGVILGASRRMLFVGQRFARNGKKYLVQVEVEGNDSGPHYTLIRATAVPVIGWFDSPIDNRWVSSTFDLGPSPTLDISPAIADPRESSHLSLMFSKLKPTLDDTRVKALRVPVKLDLLLNDNGTIDFYPHVQPGDPVDVQN